MYPNKLVNRIIILQQKFGWFKIKALMIQMYYLRKVARKSAEQDDHMYRLLPPLSTESIMKSESAGQALFSPS